MTFTQESHTSLQSIISITGVMIVQSFSDLFYRNLPLYLQAWPEDTAFDFTDLKKKMGEYLHAKNVMT